MAKVARGTQAAHAEIADLTAEVRRLGEELESLAETETVREGATEQRRRTEPGDIEDVSSGGCC